jgi:LemA protein
MYNSTAGSYNSMRLQIPTVFFANAMGFKEAPYFDFDNLQAIKDFKTDDGEMLKNVISGVTSKAKDATKKGIDMFQSIRKESQKADSIDDITCEQCGAALPKNSKFCSECGAKII